MGLVKKAPKATGLPCPCPLCTGEPRSEHTTPGVAKPVLNRETGSPPTVFCQCSVKHWGNIKRELHTIFPHTPSVERGILYGYDRCLTINRTERAVKANWVIKVLNILGFTGRIADKASFEILFPWICFIFHFYFLGRRDTDRPYSSMSEEGPALTNVAGEGQARTSTFQLNYFASATSFYHSWCKWRQVKGTWKCNMKAAWHMKGFSFLKGGLSLSALFDTNWELFHYHSQILPLATCP